MAKDEGISVAIQSDHLTMQAMYEEIKKQLEKMSAAMVKTTFTGAIGRHAYTGLRAALDPLDAWKFGTVHRNKWTDERVMAVGHRKVTGLTEARYHSRGWKNTVGDTVDDWFDYWEVEQDT